MAAVAQDGDARKWELEADALQFASYELKGDKEVVMAAVAQNGLALKWASNALKGDKEFVMAAVAQNGFALAYALNEFKRDKEVVMAAVKNNGKAFHSASNVLQEDKQFIQIIINNLHTNNTTLTNEIKQLRAKLTNYESISVLNVDTNQEEIMPRPPSSSSISSTSSSSTSSSSNKRKHESIESIIQNVNKRVKVKVDELEDQLEEAQDLNGYMVRSENNKMTEIDSLKQQMQTMQRRIDELER